MTWQKLNVLVTVYMNSIRTDFCKFCDLNIMLIVNILLPTVNTLVVIVINSELNNVVTVKTLLLTVNIYVLNVINMLIGINMLIVVNMLTVMDGELNNVVTVIDMSRRK
ncbi:hypothetical protein GGU10DRAFT_337916 [Lentinula aff. detonsa]|uniref:Uncharacterized protein n=1 Tax=Lentinula aff. detonsa TaxID=2804958 RepID=A0AA38L262_9AGAR|nr:hypothetical protein GGU10DRAFT_337916 [Lentinula aff. detonsa]